MHQDEKQDPMHGMTLDKILRALVSYYGWGELGIHVKIRCFNANPSIKSSLTFLRRAEWARTKVEYLYRDMLREQAGEDQSGDEQAEKEPLWKVQAGEEQSGKEQSGKEQSTPAPEKQQSTKKSTAAKPFAWPKAP